MSSNLTAPGLAESIAAEAIAHICSCTQESAENLSVLPLYSRKRFGPGSEEFCGLVYHADAPKFFIHYNTDSATAQALEIMLTKLSTRLAPIPKLLEVLETEGLRVNIEEFPDGPSLELLVNAGLITITDATAKARNWLNKLAEKTREPSNSGDFVAELHGLLELAKKHSLLPANDLSSIEDAAMAPINSGLTVFRSLVIPQLTLRDIVISNHIICRNLLRCTLSHFHCCNWLSLWEHSPSLTQQQRNSLPYPRDFNPSTAGPNGIQTFETIFDLNSLQYTLAELPESLHQRAVARCREAFSIRARGGIVPRQALDPIVPAVGLPRQNEASAFLSKDLTALKLDRLEIQQKYSSVQSELAERNRSLGEAQTEIDKLHQQLAEAQTDIAEISEKVEGLADSLEANREVAVLKDQLAHRDQVLQSIVKSPGYRLGKAVSTAAKKIPGLKQAAAVIKNK